MIVMLQIKCVDQFVNNVNSTLQQRHDHERLKDITARIESYDVVVSRETCLVNARCFVYFLILNMGNDIEFQMSPALLQFLITLYLTY